MNLFIRSRILKPTLIGNLARYSNATTEIPEQNEQVFLDDSDEALAKEAAIEKKRNKSRLSTAHYNLIHHRRPYESAKHLCHFTVKYHRKLYGLYGMQSGVNPSLCWPSSKDIQDTLEYESVAYPFTITQMMETAAQKRQQQQQTIEERERDLAIKFAKLDQWKKELQDKIQKKTNEVQAAKLKKERLVEEVRRHFGFTLDPRDEKFQEMLAKREKEQKKLDKQARREAKEKVMIAKLHQKNVEISDTTKAS